MQYGSGIRAKYLPCRCKNYPCSLFKYCSSPVIMDIWLLRSKFNAGPPRALFREKVLMTSTRSIVSIQTQKHKQGKPSSAIASTRETEAREFVSTVGREDGTTEKREYLWRRST